MFFSFFKNNNVKKLLQHFQDTFLDVTESSRNLFSQTEILKKSIDNESRIVQSSASAIEEISSMLSRTTEESELLKSITGESQLKIEESERFLNQLEETMGHLQTISVELLQSTQEKLRELETVTTSLKNVQGKTTIINDIVFQTKLLSFNASVEAARAGDHGKGFAVVAEEMGNLAQHSGKASIEIETIVKSTVDSTSSTVSEVTKTIEGLSLKTNKEIENAIKHLSSVVHSIRSLKESFTKIDVSSKEIALAAVEQEKGVNDIKSSMHEIEKISHELATVAESNHKTSIYLAETTEKLSPNIGQIAQTLHFKLNIKTKPFDFNAAKSAHIGWKMKLVKYLEKPDNSLNPDTVCKDNACVLGKWIYGDGQLYKTQHSTLFEKLRNSHAEFHKTAAQIITYANQGNEIAAHKLMSPTGEYSQISDNTVKLIDELEVAVEKIQSVA